VALQDVLQRAKHEFLVEGIRMVKVEEALLGLGLLGGGEFTIEAVLADGDHLALRVIHFRLTQLLHNLLADRRLAAGRSAGHADQERGLDLIVASGSVAIRQSQRVDSP